MGHQSFSTLLLACELVPGVFLHSQSFHSYEEALATVAMGPSASRERVMYQRQMMEGLKQCQAVSGQSKWNTAIGYHRFHLPLNIA